MKLTPRQLILCERTISANAFFHLVSHAITTHDNLSVVRAADGEKKFLTHCPEPGNPLLMPFGGLTEDWLVRFGCLGIPRPLLALRIVQAVTECHYYAPSMSGITMPEYDVYDLSIRNSYVDNQFPNLWTEEQKAQLFVEAKHVTLIHASRKLADAMQARAKKYHGVKVQYLPLTNWREADSVISEANRIGAPLTIFAAGPASKFIGPRIKGVTLDIGQAMDRWTFLPQFEREKQRAKESGVPGSIHEVAVRGEHSRKETRMTIQGAIALSIDIRSAVQSLVTALAGSPTENRTDMRPGGQFQREEFSRDQDQERNAARADL